jgi:hypothetical protein
MLEAEASRPKGRLKWLGIAIASSVLLVVVMEVGVRVYALIRPEVMGKLRPNLEKVIEESPMEAHPYLAYAGKPGFQSQEGAPIQKSHNQWGFRGKPVPLAKGPDVYRVVCLGGSSTYGHGPTSDATTWPARLEHWLNDPNVWKNAIDGPSLNDVEMTRLEHWLNDPNLATHGKHVEVLNGGLSGWSTFESTVNLAFRMVEFDPDLVIVYHTINDMRCALYDPPLPADQRAFPGPMIDNRHWRDTWPRVVESPGENLLEHSMTYLVLRHLFTDYTKGVDSLNNWAIVDYDPAAHELYRRGEVPETGFRSFERNLRTIDAIATAHGAKVILASQANDDRDIMAGSREAQLEGMRRMTGIIELVAAETGAVYVDAKTELEAKAVELGPDNVFTKEVHLTDLGAEQLSLVFAKAILLGGHGLLE